MIITGIITCINTATLTCAGITPWFKMEIQHFDGLEGLKEYREMMKTLGERKRDEGDEKEWFVFDAGWHECYPSSR